MRGNLRVPLYSVALAALLVCSEWWLFAGLALFWLYVDTIGVSQDGVLDRTRHGLAWLWLGVVVLCLFPTGPGWHLGASMLIGGWITMAREPLWST